jgi:hypothetical protein
MHSGNSGEKIQMSQDESSKPAIDFTEPKKKQKHRKDKPWDTEDIDHWKIDTFTPEDNKHHLLEESSFATLFPQVCLALTLFHRISILVPRGLSEAVLAGDQAVPGIS